MSIETVYYYGQGITPDDENEVLDYLAERNADMYEPMEGETPKTGEQHRKMELYIGHVLAYMKEELGVKIDHAISPDQIHFFSDEIFQKRFPNERRNAFRISMHNRWIVNTSAWTDTALDVPMIQGIVELYAPVSYSADLETVSIAEYRSGVIAVNPKGDMRGEIPDHMHFNGLHGTLKEYIVRKIALGRIGPYLRRQGSIARDITDTDFSPEYTTNLRILDRLISRIAEAKSEPMETVVRRFERSYFTGNIAHLRDTDRALGIGALRVIGAWESATREGDEEEMNLRILQFVDSDRSDLREYLAADIMNDQELYRFQKIRKMYFAGTTIYGEKPDDSTSTSL